MVLSQNAMKVRRFARLFANDEQGVVTVEWVAIAGIFVMTAVATFLLIGDEVNLVLNEVLNQMEEITNGV